MKPVFTILPTVICGVILLISSACQSVRLEYSGTIVGKMQNKIKENIYKQNPNHDWQTFDLLGQSLAIFLLINADGVPNKIMPHIESAVIKSLNDGNLFQPIVSPSETLTRLKTDAVLNQRRSVYLDSLSAIAISDKDIAIPMGQYLGVENFFIFQIDNWPCEQCILKDRIRLKARLINAITSDIVWTGIYELSVIREKPEDFKDLAVFLTKELMSKFHIQFKKKWHKKRFHQLAALATK